jgi:hypothetical protein
MSSVIAALLVTLYFYLICNKRAGEALFVMIALCLYAPKDQLLGLGVMSVVVGLAIAYVLGACWICDQVNRFETPRNWRWIGALRVGIFMSGPVAASVCALLFIISVERDIARREAEVLRLYGESQEERECYRQSLESHIAESRQKAQAVEEMIRAMQEQHSKPKPVDDDECADVCPHLGDTSIYDRVLIEFHLGRAKFCEGQLSMFNELTRPRPRLVPEFLLSICGHESSKRD